MTTVNHQMATVIGRRDELPPEQRVWGTGSWLPPESREALDWITLLRLCGRKVEVRYINDRGFNASPFVVVAAPPEQIGEGLVDEFRHLLMANRLTLVLRAGPSGTPITNLGDACHPEHHHEGRSLRWVGPGRATEWVCRTGSRVHHLEVSNRSEVWASLDDRPVVSARRFGKGTVVTLAFHPSRASDDSGSWNALLRHLLLFASPVPVATLDWEETMVLRMDDPGGAQNVYNANWSYPKLGSEEWADIRIALRRREARLSIGYVSGWVDDGDEKRGALTVMGKKVDRIPGRIYPSRDVLYADIQGHAPGSVHDYSAEYAGIQALRAEGLGDVELHGYTHLRPDRKEWIDAPDRYRSDRWYREFEPGETGGSGPADAESLARGIEALGTAFDVFPTTLIPPGDEWSNLTLEHALTLGLQLVSSYYLAIAHDNRFVWAQQICAPYLDKPAPKWFDAGLPVVGYFHDMEPALQGVEWFSHWLEGWASAGAHRFIDFRELAAALGSHFLVRRTDDRLEVEVVPGSTRSVRPIRLKLFDPEHPLRSTVKVIQGERSTMVTIDRIEDHVGIVHVL